MAKHKEMNRLCNRCSPTACRDTSPMQRDERALSPKSLRNTMRALTQQLINKDYAVEGSSDSGERVGGRLELRLRF